MANTLHYPRHGGHRWAYMNWALGFRSIGCDVIWLEWADPQLSAGDLTPCLTALKAHLAPYGCADRVVVIVGPQAAAAGATVGAQDGVTVVAQAMKLDRIAADADVLVNFVYGLPANVVSRFRNTALVDIDPGLLQCWMAQDLFPVAPHDAYFTIGETVGTRTARFPDAGRRWTYTPPCVSLEAWPVEGAVHDAPFSTITHWSGDEYAQDGDDWYLNDKRSAFLPFLDLPRRVSQRLEIAAWLGDGEVTELVEHGWRVRHSYEVAATPWDYQAFVRGSRGEWSCAKPSYVRLQTAWISDRTLCYLASGRPAIVQDTGPSRILPDSHGLFRFRDIDDAIRCLREADEHHDDHARAARTLAAEHFDARCVVRRVLERTVS